MSKNSVALATPTDSILRRITGWKPRKYSSEFEDPLAYNKFVVFGLVSSLFVPQAAKLFSCAVHTERKQTADEHRRRRISRKTRRDKEESHLLEKRIDLLHAALFDSCYSAESTADAVGTARPPFPPPHWTGEKRPHGARRFQLHSNFPSADYLRYLVSQLGYRGDAAISSLSRAHEPWAQVSDRRKANAFNADEQGDGQNHQYSSFSPEHPYRPESPMLRTRSGGGFKKAKVTEAIAKHRWDDKTSTAVFEVVYMRRKPFFVATSLGLRVETVYQYCSRLRADLQSKHEKS